MSFAIRSRVNPDYVPVVATAAHAYYMQHKIRCTPNYTRGNIEKALYDERLQNIPWLRCAFLVIPIVVNNIFIALLDLCLSHYGNSLLNRAKSLQQSGERIGNRLFFSDDTISLKYLSLLRWAAFVGNTEALTLLAQNDDKLSLKTKMQYLKRAAAEGNTQALLELGHRYHRGASDNSATVVAKDLTIAGEFYELSANLGNAEAQCLVGGYYQKSYEDIFKVDNKKGAKFYQLAANQGSAQGQYELGCCYENGKGVAKDPKQAAKLYQLAVDQGYAWAQFALARLLEEGAKGVEKDEKKAFELYGLAAKQNHNSAMHALGHCFEKGIGVKQSKEEAFKVYKSAAEFEYGFEARNALGRCYAYGIGVQQDLKQAWELLTKGKDFYTSTLQDRNPDTKILLQLGQDCAEGTNGMKKDLPWAYQCYHKLADAAPDKPLSAKEAKYRLGRLYLDNGNISLARIYLKAADEAWHPKAKKWLDKLPPEQAPRS